jgi:hypothetical protein
MTQSLHAEDGKHCMQKVHRRYKYTGQRGDQVARYSGNLQWLLEFCCGDSWVKKNQSGAAKAWGAHNPDIANDMSRKAIRQTEQRSGAEQ